MKEGALAWITGGNGLIGHHLIRSAPEFAGAIRARGISRSDVELLDHGSVAELFRREKPGLVIHCAAMSKSPACEADPPLARSTNVEVTQQLAELAADIPFIFFSTDLVFDGRKGMYEEEDRVNPLSVYAETKVLAEEAVRRHPNHLIVRISITGGESPGRSQPFNEEMKKAWRNGQVLRLFTDEFRCPSSAPILARAVWELVVKNARGTCHLCFPERLSRYEMGVALAAKHPELSPRIEAASRKEYKGPPRPEDTSLNSEKARGLLSFELPAFTEWLRADTTGF